MIHSHVDHQEHLFTHWYQLLLPFIFICHRNCWILIHFALSLLHMPLFGPGCFPCDLEHSDSAQATLLLNFRLLLSTIANSLLIAKACFFSQPFFLYHHELSVFSVSLSPPPLRSTPHRSLPPLQLPSLSFWWHHKLSVSPHSIVLRLAVLVYHGPFIVCTCQFLLHLAYLCDHNLSASLHTSFSIQLAASVH